MELIKVYDNVEKLYLVRYDGQDAYAVEVHEHQSEPVRVILLTDHTHSVMLDIFVVPKTKDIDTAIEDCCKEYENFNNQLENLVTSLAS